MSDEDHARPGLRKTADHRFYDDQHLLPASSSSIFFVVNTLVGLGVASVGITPVSYVMVSPLQVLVLGIPTMLFYSKVRKSGMLLILSDESTASIEHENETMIQKAIGRLIENRTVLIIAHKLRSVVACDQIVVLNEGKLIWSS